MLGTTIGQQRFDFLPGCLAQCGGVLYCKRNDKAGVGTIITINICGDNVGIFTTCSVMNKEIPNYIGLSSPPKLRAPQSC